MLHFARYLKQSLVVLICLGMFSQPARIVASTPAQGPPLPFTQGHIKQAQAGWHVYAVDKNGTVLSAARTDAEGQFVFAGLPTRGFTIQVRDVNGVALALPPNAIVMQNHADGGQINALAPAGMSNLARALKMEMDSGGAISGTLLVAQTNAPAPFNLVYLYTSTQQTRYDYAAITFSSVNGNFVFADLPAGNYFVCTQPLENLLRECFDNHPSLANADAITVTSSNTATVNMALEVGGVISGSVRAAQTGAPVASASVYLYTSTQPSASGYAEFSSTDANGIYAFSGLPEGRYYVRAEPPSSHNLLYEFFNNKLSLATADAISVTLGQTTTASIELDFGGAITGRVTASDTGLPLPQFYVWLYGPRREDIAVCGDKAFISFVDLTTTDASGVYTFTGLAAGNYIIEFDDLSDSYYFDEYYNDQPTRAAATPIRVTSGSTTDQINAALQRGGSITGRVTADDTGAGLPYVWVDAYRKEGNLFRYANDDYTDANGYFTVTQLIAGDHYLNIYPWTTNDSARAYAREAYNNRKPYDYVDAVPVSLGSNTANINIGLARGGQITGHITSGDTNQPLADVNIYVRQPTGYGSFPTYAGETDANGLYTTTGVLSGSYVVEFEPRFSSNLTTSNYLAEYYNNQPDASTALSVVVTAPNVTLNIDAQLARGGMITGVVNITGGLTGSIAVKAFLAVSNNTFSFKETASDPATGQYALRGLPSNAYKVQFGPHSTSITAQCVTTTTRYAEVWYLQKPDWASATLVQVTAPNIAPNISAMLGSVDPPPTVTPTVIPTTIPTPIVTPTVIPTPTTTPRKVFVYLPIVPR